MVSVRCFLIDDDEDEHEFFEMALNGMPGSFEYRAMSSSCDALKWLTQPDAEIPDYIFLDLNIPNLNGKECLKILKNIPQLQSTPIIIYSTSSFEKDILDCQASRASHYVIKPSEIATLINILSTLFKGEPMPFLIK